MSDYDRLRKERPDLLAACAEVGHAVACQGPDVDRLTLAAVAEARAVEIVAALVCEPSADQQKGAP